MFGVLLDILKCMFFQTRLLSAAQLYALIDVFPCQRCSGLRIECVDFVHNASFAGTLGHMTNRELKSNLSGATACARPFSVCPRGMTVIFYKTGQTVQSKTVKFTLTPKAEGNAVKLAMLSRRFGSDGATRATHNFCPSRELNSDEGRKKLSNHSEEDRSSSKQPHSFQ